MVTFFFRLATWLNAAMFDWVSTINAAIPIKLLMAYFDFIFESTSSYCICFLLASSDLSWFRLIGRAFFLLMYSTNWLKLSSPISKYCIVKSSWHFLNIEELLNLNFSDSLIPAAAMAVYPYGWEASLNVKTPSILSSRSSVYSLLIYE